MITNNAQSTMRVYTGYTTMMLKLLQLNDGRLAPASEVAGGHTIPF
jgi:hypothetical protein